MRRAALQDLLTLPQSAIIPHENRAHDRLPMRTAIPERGRWPDMSKARGAKRRPSLPGQAWQLAGIVLVFILVPLVLGLWLDRRYHTAPWWMLLGMLIGVAASTAMVVHRAYAAYQALDQELAAKRKRRRPASSPLQAGNEKEDI